MTMQCLAYQFKVILKFNSLTCKSSDFPSAPLTHWLINQHLLDFLIALVGRKWNWDQWVWVSETRRLVEQTIALMCGQTFWKWPKRLDGWPKSNFRFGPLNGNVNGCLSHVIKTCHKSWAPFELWVFPTHTHYGWTSIPKGYGYSWYTIYHLHCHASSNYLGKLNRKLFSCDRNRFCLRKVLP